MTEINATNLMKDEFLQKSNTPGPTATPINSGDLVYWESTTKTAMPYVLDANGAGFMGVSLDTTPMSVVSTDYLPTINVRQRGQFKFNSTAGDTYNPGDALYIGADAQTVTNTAGGMTTKIATVAMDPSMVALAGGTGVKVLADVVAKYPTTA
jgi:hypothetical protein